MSKQQWWAVGLAGYMVIVLALPFGVHHRWAEGHYTWDEYGAWLQGALIPGLLLFAILAFHGNAEAQREANRLTAHALFLAHLQGYHDRINYACTMAVIGRQLPAKEIEAENLEGIGRLLNIVTAKQGDSQYPEGHRLVSMSYPQIRDGTELRVVTRDIDNVIALARQTGVAFMLDPRIIELQAELQLLRTRRI